MADQSVSLAEFIRAAKAKGASDGFVVDLLRSRGWSEKRILDAFAAFYEAETGLGVPSRGGLVEAARDAFLHLLSFIALGTWTCSLGSLFYTVIDHYVPPLNAPPYSLPTRASVSYEMAGILVAFPLYLLIMRGMAKAAQANPERLLSSVRKWLTYIALLIAAGILLGDVVAFLAFLLRGDLTTRFVLQVLTLAVLAGGVMRYYLTTLRDEAPPAGHNRIFAGVATVAVVLGLGLGLTLSGSPARQPALARDERRLQDMAMITREMWAHWNQRDPAATFVLPPSLDDIAQGTPLAAHLSDPSTGQRYEYKPGEGTHYALCAVFEEPTPSEMWTAANWRHRRGRTCFQFEATGPSYYQGQ
jgi:hypothetical protein